MDETIMLLEPCGYNSGLGKLGGGTGAGENTFYPEGNGCGSGDDSNWNYDGNGFGAGESFGRGVPGNLSGDGLGNGDSFI